MTLDDWRYSDDKMKVRDQALKVLLSKFGHQMEGVLPKYSNQSIYECAHDWVSQGNSTTFGLSEYYEVHYAKTN